MFKRAGISPTCEFSRDKGTELFTRLTLPRTNLVTFVQLLNHERSLKAEANSYLKNLNLAFDDEVLAPISSTDASMLGKYMLELVADVQSLLRGRQHSASLTMADRILYENAHEAIGQDFAVPGHDPISEESLAELPIGVQIRHLIRKLRLDIQHRGSCDFKRLDRLLSQLGHGRSGWAARFSLLHYPEWLFDGLHLEPAYSLVISQELLTEPLIRIWVRGYILRTGNETSPFPITRFAELWNSDSNSVNLLTLAGGDVEDFQHLPLLHVAVLCNKPRIVRTLVKDNPNGEWLLTLDNFSAFHSAASIGSIDCYRELLKCDEAESAIGEWYGYLPLHSAARNGHKHMVDYILSIHPDDEDYVNTTNASGVTPLMQAAKHGKYDVVQFLLDYPGVDLTASDENWRTALTHANENENIFRLILSRLPDQYFNTPGEEGQIPLHWLVIHAGPNAVRLVLNLASILPDQEEETGATPLCHAVKAGNLEVVKALAIRRDVDVTKLSTCELWNKTNYIDDAKLRASKNNNYSQILDWLKIHCKELKADLADWEITTEDAAQGMTNSERNTQKEQ